MKENLIQIGCKSAQHIINGLLIWNNNPTTHSKIQFSLSIYDLKIAFETKD